jgi:hypothetical protein
MSASIVIVAILRHDTESNPEKMLPCPTVPHKKLTVRTIVWDTIERGETPKGTVRDVEESNTRYGI